jgi:hypothetical protein
VKAASHNIRLSHPFTNAKRTDVAALKIRPLVQSLASLAQNGFRTLPAQFLEDDITVSGPLVFETIFIVLEFARDQKIFTGPRRALLVRTVIIQNRIANSRGRDPNLAKLSYKEPAVVIGINFAVGDLPSECNGKIVRSVFVGECRKLVGDLVAVYR